MLFKEFSGYLEKLEKISSRLEITDVLADLIKKMEVEEVDKGIYLTLGQLGPDFANQEFSMAVKMVLRAVREGASDVSLDIEKEYKKRGDLGVLVEEIEFREDKKKKNTIVEVFEQLKAMAEDGGSGSQERKVASLHKLLVSVSPIERKFIVRMVMGKLRLGFSSKTIFDALSQIESGSKSLRKDLDNVFQIYPDPGYIAMTVKKEGLAGLKNIKVKTGVPVVPALCQRINSYQEIIEKMGEVAVERKYDGTRVQIHFDRAKNEIKTYTRNLEETSNMFPELKKIGDFVVADKLILDCEAVGFDPKSQKILSFQATITRKRKHDVEEAAVSVPLRFFVFDVLNVNGESMLTKQYYERRGVLAKIIKKNDVLVVDEHVRTTDPDKIEVLHDKFLQEGYEGAVIKMWSGKYLPGRQGWNWVKIKEAEGETGKLSDTLDLVVMGYYLGRGKRAGFGIGAFLVGVKRGEVWESLAKVGTGLTDEEFVDLRKKLESCSVGDKPANYHVEGTLVPDVWVIPKVVMEIAADEITKSPSHGAGIALRFPRLVKFRDDKGPDQATTWDEVLRIAKISKV